MTTPIIGKANELSTSLTRKLTRRGVYDPEVAAVKLEATAKELRELVYDVYGERAWVALDRLRREVESLGLLDSNDLTAETQFYLSAIAKIKQSK